MKRCAGLADRRSQADQFHRCVHPLTCPQSANHGFVAPMTGQRHNGIKHASARFRGGPAVRPNALILACLTLFVPLTPMIAETNADALRGATGLALPRFVSLKADRVNLRQGPGTDYPTAWVYHRAGLPVEILKEYDGWRQIRDADGAVGWVQGIMLSGRRTALVTPWVLKPGAAQPVPASTTIDIREDDRTDARTIAFVEPGVVAGVMDCNGRWCRITAGDVRGYVEQAKLWGVYEGEIVK
jgi:SH3-like domain-containing protein